MPIASTGSSRMIVTEGWGRGMGPEMLELYTETKAVCVQL